MHPNGRPEQSARACSFLQVEPWLEASILERLGVLPTGPAALPAGLGASSPAGGLFADACPLAAFALLDGPGLTQFRIKLQGRRR